MDDTVVAIAAWVQACIYSVIIVQRRAHFLVVEIQIHPEEHVLYNNESKFPI